MTLDSKADPVGFITTALTEVLFGNEDDYPLIETIDRYFSPDYQQRIEGELVDRDGFIEHVRKLRSIVVEGRVEVIESVREGDRIAMHRRLHSTEEMGRTCNSRCIRSASSRATAGYAESTRWDSTLEFEAPKEATPGGRQLRQHFRVEQ